nr:DUF3467 domain-containing protein [uncultured Desulfobacter sp.]
MTDKSKTIRWCDDNSRSLSADMSSVISTRDEICLLFGVSRMPTKNNEEIQVELKKGIVLSPLVAKRFSVMLNNVLQKYESDFKTPESDHTIEKAGGINQSPVFPIDHEENTKAGPLLHSLSGLNLKYGLERSFKLSHKRVNDNRFLLGVSKDEIPADVHKKIKEISQQLNMPAVFANTLENNLADANYIHFGYEASGTSCIYKIYLEFWEKIQRQMQKKNDRPDQVLLHLGYKWCAADNKIHALSRYTWHPWITVKDILMRIKGIFHLKKYQTPLNIVSNIVKLAAENMPHHDFLYLEVTEGNNPRRSFDINMYRANLTMEQLKPFLQAIFCHYNIPEEKLNGLYGPIKSEAFGHISGGIDREGKDFLTLYYGMKEAGIEVRQSNRRRDDHPTKILKSGTHDEKAGYLIKLVKTLHVKIGFERSFKLLPNMILPDRFLIGFKKVEVKDHAEEQILDICRQINMPIDYVETFKRNLPAATIVLFGYERHHQNSIYKAYLEFGGGFKTVFHTNPHHPPPFVIHLGLKWDAADNRKRAIARYTCFPGIGMDTIFEKMATVLYGTNSQTSLEIAKGIVNLAADRIDPRVMLYLEATEEGNPRKSYDINLYLADLKMEMLEPWLHKMTRACAIPDADFRYLYEGIKQHKFGHLSAGIDRGGRDFFTVYFKEP